MKRLNQSDERVEKILELAQGPSFFVKLQVLGLMDFYNEHESDLEELIDRQEAEAEATTCLPHSDQ